ncbi:MAG: DUF302 domain-containing protein [Hydrogenothermus sp.]|nr:MAG: DUF302 domain-containing protein [Hydrogenothermus sp.]
MKKLKLLLVLVLLLTVSVYSYEDDVQHDNGYYYIIIKNKSPKLVNAIVVEEIYKAEWDIVTTINVDKTSNLKTFYKTHLICQENYLSKGVRKFKEIGNLIPCRITVLVEGTKVKVMAEDIEEIAKIYGIKDKEFLAFLKKVQDELVSILVKTASRLSPKTFKPMY